MENERLINFPNLMNTSILLIYAGDINCARPWRRFLKVQAVS